MPDPIVILTDHGSIELSAGAGDCIVDACRKKGGNMVRFVVHHTDYERPVGFKVCGTHFAEAVGQMMASAPRRDPAWTCPSCGHGNADVPYCEECDRKWPA